MASPVCLYLQVTYVDLSSCLSVAVCIGATRVVFYVALTVSLLWTGVFVYVSVSAFSKPLCGAFG